MVHKQLIVYNFLFRNGGMVMSYRWTWIWRTTVRRIFAYDGRYAWSQSDAYQVFVICLRQILHMKDQFSWSHWVRHIQVNLYFNQIFSLLPEWYSIKWKQCKWWDYKCNINITNRQLGEGGGEALYMTQHYSGWEVRDWPVMWGSL